jgi:hypothetical protein
MRIFGLGFTPWLLCSLAAAHLSRTLIALFLAVSTVRPSLPLRVCVCVTAQCVCAGQLFVCVRYLLLGGADVGDYRTGPKQQAHLSAARSLAACAVPTGGVAGHVLPGEDGCVLSADPPGTPVQRVQYTLLPVPLAHLRALPLVSHGCCHATALREREQCWFSRKKEK